MMDVNNPKINKPSEPGASSELNDMENNSEVSTENTDAKIAIKIEEPENGSSVDTQDVHDRDDDELEEGELKDDDDDDDEDLDEVDGKKTVSSDESDESEPNERKETVSSSSSSSGGNGSDSSSSKISSRSSEASANDTKKLKSKISSTRSSSPNPDLNIRAHSFSSRHESHSRHSSRSQSRSRRQHSPASSNQQARLVTMRAKLLEAKSREIEMKFQKNKTHIATSSPLSTISTLVPARNLKTTVAKPPITYAENPNPVNPPPDTRERSKVSRPVKNEVKEKSKASKKSSKKRKKKSTPKKKKRTKTSETPRKDDTHESKDNPVNIEIPYDNIDRQGPKTPPDNQVLTLEDEQVEWPSYLIKMTITQPPISYSVNPDSVAGINSVDQSETADLNADFNWYYNYFLNTVDMDKSQAQHQASSIIISSTCYGNDKLNRWLEQQGYSKQLDNRDETQKDSRGDADLNGANPQVRSNKPTFTYLKSTREITLPNGTVLPRGTVQKIVHPYPRSERMIPEVKSAHSDFY